MRWLRSWIILLCRFVGLKKVGGSGFKTRVAAAIVVCVWIYNVTFNIPVGVWAMLKVSRRRGVTRCRSGEDDVNYLLASRIINFFLPLTITWTSYIGIIFKLKKTMNKAILLNLY